MNYALIPKLYYFDNHGPSLGEIGRLVLAFAGRVFIDVKIKYEDEWDPTFKEISPLGKAPYYEQEGVWLGGCLPIARYLAEDNGMGLTDPFECALVDSCADAALDLIFRLHDVRTAEEAKKEEMKKAFSTLLPARLLCIEKHMKGAESFLVGKVCYVDFVICVLCLDISSIQMEESLSKCIKMNNVTNRIDKSENVQAWRTPAKK